MTDKKKPFPALRLLAVLGIVAIVGAVLFPVIQNTQNVKQQASCLSNERRLAAAISQYVQDNDQTYPWSTSRSDNTPNWEKLVDPYVHDLPKTNEAFSCPSGKTPSISYSVNSQIIGLLDMEHKSPSIGWYNSVVHSARIRNPHETVLLSDALVGSGGRSARDFAYPHPANVKDHTSDSGWETNWFDIPYNNHQISWRHNGGANFVFCDGHVMYAKPGNLKDTNWDVRCQYGKVCEGSPKSPVYPAADGTCGDQSPINCQ